MSQIEGVLNIFKSDCINISVVNSVSQNHLCEGRSLTCPDLPTHGGGTPIRAL